MAKIDININYCKGCNLCVLACKRDVIKVGETSNVLGYHYAIAENMDKCIGCKMCAVTCPEAAIEVYK